MEKMVALGQNLRACRKAAGLRLEDLSHKAGLSRSYISAVERGRVNPSIAALKKLAEALGQPLAGFFEEKTGHHPGKYLVRRNERKVLVYPGESVRMELLAPDVRRRMEPLFTRAAPGMRSGVYSHIGEEVGIVLKGELDVWLGDDRYRLRAGDAIYFESILSHRWENHGKRSAEAIWVITPPTF